MILNGLLFRVAYIISVAIVIVISISMCSLQLFLSFLDVQLLGSG